MSASVLSIAQQKAFRAKAKLNVCIAQDLADGFGGNEIDYLKRLNRKLKREIFHTISQNSIFEKKSHSNFSDCETLLSQQISPD
jgi:hypothetical protein